VQCGAVRLWQTFVLERPSRVTAKELLDTADGHASAASRCR
jgi:hypothetical protein